MLQPASHCPFRSHHQPSSLSSCYSLHLIVHLGLINNHPLTSGYSLHLTVHLGIINNHPLASCYSLHLTVHLGLINNHPLSSGYSLHLTVHLGLINNHPLSSCYSLHLTIHLGLINNHPLSSCYSLHLTVHLGLINNHPLSSCYSLHITVHLGLINNHPLSSCYSLHLTVHLGLINNHPLSSCYSLHLTLHVGLINNHSLFLLQPASHCPFRYHQQPPSLFLLQPASHCPFRSPQQPPSRLLLQPASHCPFRSHQQPSSLFLLQPASHCPFRSHQQRAGHIYRTVTHKSVQTVVPLYKALVRPHLEYCSLVWSPYLKKDILSIGKVQRRVTKMIPSISALTYEERLKRTGLISLENRRLRADLLEVFKILKGFVKVDPATHFSMSDRRSRGHTLKLEKPRARLELRRHFFSNRVIDAWNSLPGHMVEATSTNMFKAALQRLLHGAFKIWNQLPAPRGHLTT